MSCLKALKTVVFMSSPYYGMLAYIFKLEPVFHGTFQVFSCVLMKA